MQKEMHPSLTMLRKWSKVCEAESRKWLSKVAELLFLFGFGFGQKFGHQEWLYLDPL